MNPSYQYSIPGIYEVQLVATALGGCQDSITQTLVVTNQVDFYVPNAFSPNGDGYNDNFEVFPIGLIEDYKITIFNRWGGTIFQSNDLNLHWDGYAKGKLAQEGVYVIEYQFANFINGGSQKKILSGDLTIVK